MTATPQIAIAAPHTLAVDAAREIVGEGGTAVDAAVAAAAALTVVYPHQCSVGGDLFAIVRRPDGTMTSINASGAYGTGAPPPETVARFGPMSVTLPGVVSGWQRLLDVGGTLPVARLLAPAIRYAEQGVVVGERLGAAIAKVADRANPDLLELIGPLGAGDLLVQSRLAETLTRLADDGLLSIYDDRLVAAFERHGIPITAEDLRGHRVIEEPPLTAELDWGRVSTSPPNSQGHLLLEMLRVLEPQGEVGADVLARLFADVEVRRTAGAKADGDTVAVTVVSDDGTAVSLIQSLYSSFGSGVHDGPTGITFHNRAAGFSSDPGSPNAIGGDKRPAHTLMPVIVEPLDGSLSAYGAMGGSAQPQIHLQLLRSTREGRTPQEAVSAPRFVVGIEAGEPVALVEADLDPATVESVRASGLTVQTGAALDENVGHAMICTLTASGALTAGADPRSDGGTWVSGQA